MIRRLAIGTKVVVVDAIDVEIHDVRGFIGRRGVIDGYTRDGPSYRVRFTRPRAEEHFWREELKEVAAAQRRTER